MEYLKLGLIILGITLVTGLLIAWYLSYSYEPTPDYEDEEYEGLADYYDNIKDRFEGDTK